MRTREEILTFARQESDKASGPMGMVWPYIEAILEVAFDCRDLLAKFPLPTQDK